MADKKTIGISALITIGLILVSAITPTFFDNPKYYCEAESSILQCPGGLSGGSQTRCYLNTEKDSWDYCSSGWIEITNDLKIQEEPTPPKNDSYLPAILPGKQYKCDANKCERIR